MIDRSQLEAYLDGVTQHSNAHEAHLILMRFMCRCLSLVQQALPATGRKAFSLATSFWLEGEGTAEGLLSARIECWSYLDAKGRSTEINDVEDAAMRALICVLYAEPESEDFSADTVRWFANMFDQLGHFSQETTQLMTG